MGQKVHPYGFRLGYIKDWHSNWYAKENYGATLQEDLRIRKYIEKNLAMLRLLKQRLLELLIKLKLQFFQLSLVSQSVKKVLELIRLEMILRRLAKGTLFFNIAEVKRPDAEAKLIAENIAAQLEKRVAFRRAMKKVMTSAFRSGVKGIKVKCSGTSWWS